MRTLVRTKTLPNGAARRVEVDNNLQDPPAVWFAGLPPETPKERLDPNGVTGNAARVFHQYDYTLLEKGGPREYRNEPYRYRLNTKWGKTAQQLRDRLNKQKSVKTQAETSRFSSDTDPWKDARDGEKQQEKRIADTFGDTNAALQPLDELEAQLRTQWLSDRDVANQV